MNAAMAEVETGRKGDADEGRTVWTGRNWPRREPSREGARNGARVTKKTREKRIKVRKMRDLDSARMESMTVENSLEEERCDEVSWSLMIWSKLRLLLTLVNVSGF